MPSLAAVRQGEVPTVLLVHGFTQVATSMAPLAVRLAAARRVVAVDLPGHGGSGAISADLDESAALVAAVADGEPFDLVGYSLGGRVALHAACRPPSNLRAVAVVSASPGIADPERRRARLERDVALAEALEADGDLDGFLRRWLAAPMFATLPPSRADLEGRRTNTVRGLADSLRRCSSGAQRWLGEELAKSDRPLLMVCGQRDDPYVAAARAVVDSGAPAALSVVPGAGHAAHLEQPRIVARLLDSFLPR